jgi:hypothetical protein
MTAAIKKGVKTGSNHHNTNATAAAMASQAA